MDQLKVTFRHAGHGSADLDWDGDPKGIRFRKPVEWLLGWGALYDALAANALDAAIEEATTQKPPLAKLKENAGGASPAPTRGPAAVHTWRRMEDDPPEDGQLIATSSLCGAWIADIWRWHDGMFYNPNDRSFRKPCEVVPMDEWWAPLPEFPEEV